MEKKLFSRKTWAVKYKYTHRVFSGCIDKVTFTDESVMFSFYPSGSPRDDRNWKMDRDSYKGILSAIQGNGNRILEIVERR